jgi:hypothetical protein
VIIGPWSEPSTKCSASVKHVKRSGWWWWWLWVWHWKWKWIYIGYMEMSLVNVFYKRIINTDNQIYKSILNKLNTISCLFLSTELAVICLLSIGGSWACKITETQALCPKKLSVKTDISIYCSFKVFFF